MREAKARIESETTEIFKSLCFENNSGRDFYRFSQNLIDPFIGKFEPYKDEKYVDLCFYFVFLDSE